MAPNDSDPTKQLGHETSRAAAWVFSSTIIMALCRVGLFAALGRLLTPADFGLYAAASSILGIVEILTLLGVCPALIQRKDLTSRHISSGFVIALFFGACAAASMWIAAPTIALGMHMPALRDILRVISPVFFIRALTMVGYALCARKMKFRSIATADLGSFLLYSFSTLGFAFAGCGTWSLVLGYILQHGLYALLLTLPFANQLSFRMHRKEAGELIGYSTSISFANIASYFGQQGDNYVVGRALGATSLGLYSRAYSLMQVFVTAVINTLDQVMFPALSKVQNDDANLGRTLRVSTALVSLVYLPLSALLIICAPDIVRILLGGKWLGMVTTFRILTIGLVFRAAFKMPSTILKVKARAKTFAAGQALYAVFVLGGAILGLRWGIEGVAGGVLVALGVNCLVTNILAFSALQQGLSRSVRDLFAAFIVTALVGGIGWVTLRCLPESMENPILRSGAIFVTAGIGYTFCLFVGRRLILREEARDFLRQNAAKFQAMRTRVASVLGARWPLKYRPLIA